MVRILTNEQLAILASDKETIRHQPGSIRRRIAALESHIGTDARQTIAAATEAIPYEVSPTRDPKLTTHQIRGYQILTVYDALNADHLLLLKSLILNPAHHVFKRHKDTFKAPALAIRVVAEHKLPVLIDQESETWCMRVNDSVHADSRFSPIAAHVKEFIAAIKR